MELGGFVNVGWFYCFGFDLCGYFNGCFEEFFVCCCGCVVLVFCYCELCVVMVGMWLVFVVVELGIGLFMLKEIFGVDFVEFCKWVVLLIVWVNDFYFFLKEYVVGDFFNLV